MPSIQNILATAGPEAPIPPIISEGSFAPAQQVDPATMVPIAVDVPIP